MATQEERLTAVEQFTEQAAAHIRDTEENTTILLGVIRSQGQDIKRIFERLGTMVERQEMNERSIHLLHNSVITRQCWRKSSLSWMN
jgi:hypothetical protein